MIYVIDDERMEAEAVARQLRTAGYPTEVFDNPVVALTSFRFANPKPLLLITDFNMAGANGIDGEEFLKRCKEISPTIKSISLSGNLTPEDLKAYRVKPDALIDKTNTAKQLEKAVKQLLKRSNVSV